MPTIHYFGEIADITGCSNEKLELKEMNVASLLKEFNKKYNMETRSINVAVNQNLIQDGSLKFKESDEIALLSAFAGG